MEGKPKKSPKAVRATRKKQQRKIQSLALILLGAFLIVVVTGMLFKQRQGAPIEVAGSPSLRVDTENIDLGEVKLGQTVEVAFQLTNVGDQPLKVVQAPYVQVVEGC